MKQNAQSFMVADPVTDLHADAFLRQLSSDWASSLSNAIFQSGVAEWNNECGCMVDDRPDCEHWNAFSAATDRIESRILVLAAPALRAAFIKAADEILHPAKRATGRHGTKGPRA